MSAARLFCSTVARPDPAKPETWLVMNRQGGGYACSAEGPFATLADIAAHYGARIGAEGVDQHSAFVRIEVT